MPRMVLLDTSFILALENRDPHHARAKAVDRDLNAEGTQYLLHWAVMLEIADRYARVSRRAKGLVLLDRFEQEEGYRLVPVDAALFTCGLALYRARPDKDWSLTDCISFELMRRESVTDALTADPHFRQAGFVSLLLRPLR